VKSTARLSQEADENSESPDLREMMMMMEVMVPFNELYVAT
jgi:hypothetical protein